MTGHSDDAFTILPVLRFDDDNVSDASSHIDEAEKSVTNDNRLIDSDDE